MSADEFVLSVVIPVYNAEQTVRRTVASLATIVPADRIQVQVIPVNDGSTDSTSEQIRAGREELSTFSWQTIDKPNGGAGSARNAGLALARGKWILFLDADDELAFNPIPLLRSAGDETCLGFSLEYRRGHRVLRRVRPTLLDRDNWADALTASNPFQPSSLIFRRDVIREWFREDIACVEDWLFWMSNPSLFDRMRLVPGTVAALIHLHGHNITSQYGRAGLNRTRVAELVLAMYRGRLTRRQRNNLYIQGQIGRLQQRLGVPFSTFLQVPCDFRLYLKLLVYAGAALTGLQATPYRKLQAERRTDR